MCLCVGPDEIDFEFDKLNETVANFQKIKKKRRRVLSSCRRKKVIFGAISVTNRQKLN